jgi:acyl dehydratase
MKYFDDFQVGEEKQLGSRLMSRDEIMRFGLQYDRQALHTDEIAARNTFFKGLIACGIHTLAKASSIVIDEYMLNTALVCGVSMTKVVWDKPVRPGDSITVNVKVIHKLADPTGLNMGVITTLQTVTNQRAHIVLTGEVGYLFRKKPN